MLFIVPSQIGRDAFAASRAGAQAVCSGDVGRRSAGCSAYGTTVIDLAVVCDIDRISSAPPSGAVAAGETVGIDVVVNIRRRHDFAETVALVSTEKFGALKILAFGELGG